MNRNLVQKETEKKEEKNKKERNGLNCRIPVHFF